jgi:hypothetical protein
MNSQTIRQRITQFLFTALALVGTASISIHSSAAATLAFDSTGTSPGQWGAYPFQNQFWAIDGPANFSRAFQFTSQATGSVSDIWLQMGTTGAQDIGIEIHGSLGTVLDSWIVSPSPGQNHLAVNSNLTLNSGQSYWLALTPGNISESNPNIGWALVSNTAALFLTTASNNGSGWSAPSNLPNIPGGFAIEVDASAVPLPAALPLFATGLAGLGLLGWRRKRKTPTESLTTEGNRD